MTYTYNKNCSISSVTDWNGRTTTYGYDKNGRLIETKRSNGTVEKREYDKAGQLTLILDVSGDKVVNSQPELSQVLQSKTIENNNEESAELTYFYYGQGLLTQENSKGYLTYHFNNVGSTMAVTDQNGAIKSKYNYSPYGELIEGEYDENIQFLYNGQYGVTTDGNGLYYMRARYYNVDIKRFINQDVLVGTLERISSLNRYSYVEGNPVSYLDPFGLERSYWENMHEELQNLNLVLLTIQALVACVMVVLPQFIPIGMVIEEGLATASTACAILDSFALYMMGKETTIKKEKIAYALQAMGNIVDIFTGNALAKKLLKSLDNSNFAKIITQTIPSIQQSFNNIVWG